ncbi:MAG: DUF4382 domain-containing protein [Desulfobacteraceae bacterium]|nr:DUF4382 domain-containing protein [Desulfobacteraceae bacterium]
MKTVKLILLGVISLCLAFVIGCDGSTSSSNGDTGTLSLYMTDAATDAFDAVYVTIDEVQVHKAEDDQADDNGEEANQGENGSWKVVASPQKTYNLLELVNGAMAQLGTTDLETGYYTQIRLMLGEAPDDGMNINNQLHDHPNYVIKKDSDTQEPLFVPSGYQTGIKLVHGFDMVAGQTAELVLDFDANRSVVITGNGGYLLKPTIKIVDTLNYPLVEGVVKDRAEFPNPLADVVVSAQTVDSAGRPEVFTSTLSSDQEGQIGAYQMYLPPGTYYIVAYKGGVENQEGDAAAYGPACKLLEDIQLGDGWGLEDFNLELTATGDIEVNVTLPVASEEDTPTATIRVLKTAPCGDSAAGNMIEVVSQSVGDSGTYYLSVPGSEEGKEYTVVATTSDGHTSEGKPATVIDGSTTESIVFDFTQAE